jgi:hypothetical protein
MTRWIVAVVVAWIAILSVARLTTPDTCDNWCAVQHASWLVTVVSLPVAVAALWSLLLSLVGPTVEVGLAKARPGGGTDLVRKNEAADGQPVRLRIGLKSSRFVRSAHLIAEFPPEIEEKANLELTAEPFGILSTNTQHRAQWEIDMTNVHADMANVSELILKNLPQSLGELKVELTALAEGMRRPCEDTVTLAIPKPAQAPQLTRPALRADKSEKR